MQREEMRKIIMIKVILVILGVAHLKLLRVVHLFPLRVVHFIPLRVVHLKPFWVVQLNRCNQKLSEKLKN